MNYSCPTCHGERFLAVSQIIIDNAGLAEQAIEDGYECSHCGTRITFDDDRRIQVTVRETATQAPIAPPIQNRVRSSVSAEERLPQAEFYPRSRYGPKL